MKHIVVVAEVCENLIKPVTYELIAAALNIKKQNKSGRIKIIVLSADPLALCNKIAKQTGIDVIGLQIGDFHGYNSDGYKQCLVKLIKTMEYSHVLTAHTSQGQDFAPGLAIGLKAASISAVNGIRLDDKGLLYSRSVYNNRKNMIIRPVSDMPVVLTLIPGSFKFDQCHNRKTGEMDIHKVSFAPGQESKVRIRHKKSLKSLDRDPVLKTAKTVISAGRGIGKKENLDTIVKFTECFSSSTVGASRPLVDMGWIKYRHQVGITGTKVTPELYIACGISGSSQHLVGMQDAQFVVSINRNPEAPIFRHSDICIVEDVLEFIHAFLNHVKNSNTEAE